MNHTVEHIRHILLFFIILVSKINSTAETCPIVLNTPLNKLQESSNSDLALTINSNISTGIIGDIVIYTVVLKNQGNTPVTGIQTAITLPLGVTLKSAPTPSQGSFTGNLWSIPSFSSDSATLIFQAIINTEGPKYFIAEITEMTETDIDSQPNNLNYLEDDIAVACVSIPFTYCVGEKIELIATAPTGLSDYQWYKNGTLLPSETHSTLTITSAGSYTFSAHIGINLCPAELCCPIIVSELPKPSISDVSSNICMGSSVDLTTLISSYGTYNNHVWREGSATGTIVSLQNNVTPSVSTTFFLIAENTNGCADTAQVFIAVNPLPIANITGKTTLISGETTTLTASGGVNYSWNTGGSRADIIVTPVSSASYIVTVTDMNGCKDTQIVTIILNTAPIANPDDISTNEDTPIIIAVLNNDSDIDQTLNATNITITDAPNNGTVSINPDGTIRYTPNPNFNGKDTLIYTLCDNGTPNLCDTAIVFIDVVPVNDHPIANPDAGFTLQNNPTDIFILNNDSDIDQTLTANNITITDAPNNGTALVNPDGTIRYTPNPNFNGKDTLIYTLCDNGMSALCDTAIVIINVAFINTAPIANPDVISTNEDTPIIIAVLNNDSDIDQTLNATNITITDAPSNGTASINPDGTIQYTPNPNFNGKDTLVYTLCDNGSPALCDTAIVFINVNPVNDQPIANPDAGFTLQNNPTDIFILNNDSDIDQPLTAANITITDAPNNGTASINPDGTIRYTPNPNFNGKDTLIYTLCDNGSPALCDTAIVFINVNPVNDQPIANPDAGFTVQNNPTDIFILNNDSDIDQPLTAANITITDAPNNGTASINPDGTIRYTPNPNFNGKDTLIYTLCDNGMPALCDTAIVIINVAFINTAPIANPDVISTNEDTPIIIAVLNNDSDIDQPLTATNITITDAPNNGTASINPDGTIQYTPNPNFNGKDTLIYTLCDNGTPALCDTAIVFIDVVPVNDQPIANPDTGFTVQNTSTDIFILNNDSDIDQPLTAANITITDAPNNGTASINPDGTIRYTPNPNFNGKDTLIYTLCDNGNPALCDTAIVFINVAFINTAPIANADVITTSEDAPVNITVLSNDSDIDQPLTAANITITDAPNNGTASVNPDGTIRYTPNPNFNGKDTLIYTLCDNGMPVLCDTAIVIINVAFINAAPIANPDVISTNEDTPIIIAVLNNDSDIDQPLTATNITITDAPNNGTASVNPDGTIRYSPNPNFNGRDTLIYKICDNGSPVLCDTAIVFINIIPDNTLNNAPLANVNIANTLKDEPISIDILNNDSDTEGGLNPQSVTITQNPKNGSVSVNRDGTILYSPNINFFGIDSLIYQICDNGTPTLCDTALVIVYISPIIISDNTPPMAIDDFNKTFKNNPVTGIVLLNDSDPDGNIITVNVTPVSNPKNGTVILNANGSYIYRPNLDFIGIDTFFYQICDNGIPSKCDTAKVIILIGQLGTSTTIDSTLKEGTMDTICLVSKHLLGKKATVTNICPSNGGHVDFNIISNSTCIKIEAILKGNEKGCFVVCDEFGFCDTTYINITVIDSNKIKRIKAVDDENTTLQGKPVLTHVIINDSLFNDVLTSVDIVLQGHHGQASVDTGNTVIYTPEADYCGVDSILYQICSAAGCDVAVLKINIICDRIKVYSSFSPNGDGMNDFLVIDGLNDYPKHNLEVYNRWGNLIFSSQNYKNDWSGTWQNKSVPDGTYFYVIEYGVGLFSTGYIQINR